MASYKCLKLWTSGSAVNIESTDSEAVEQLLAELRKSMHFEVKELDKHSFGGVAQVHVYALSNKDYAVYWWMVKQLCLQGWEPFVEEERGSRITMVLRFKDERT
jgi:hypothetical protein